MKTEFLSAHVRNVYLLSLILRTPTPRVWTDQICYHFHKFVRKVDFKDILGLQFTEHVLFDLKYVRYC